MDLSGANLEDTNLTDVDLNGANLTNASTKGAVLKGAVWGEGQIEVRVEHLRQNLQDVLNGHRLWIDSMGAKGARVSLGGEDFGHVDFKGTDLSGAIFRGGSYVTSNFDNCNLTLADFSNADLRRLILRSACPRAPGCKARRSCKPISTMPIWCP